MIQNEDGTVTYDQIDLLSMSPAEVTNIFMNRVKIQGTGVVRDASGKVKYDDPAQAGNYGENNV
jgi:hypothetical protein